MAFGYNSNLFLRMFNRHRPLEWLSSLIPFSTSTTDGAVGRLLRPSGAFQVFSGVWPTNNNNSTTGQVVTANAPNFQLVAGSDISYLPPTGTSIVIYRFNFSISPQTGITDVMLHFAFFIDNVEVTAARQTYRAVDNYRQGIQSFEYPIRISPGVEPGGTFTNAQCGIFSSWTTAKNLQLRVANYANAYRGQINIFRNHKVPNDNVFGSLPLVNSETEDANPNLTIIPIQYLNPTS
jgi:hypothetical protein